MIYLDNHATTRCDPRVVTAMLPFFERDYGNAASIHSCGANALRSVAEARSKVASLIGARSEEIVFTSGATESVNLALKGSLEPGDHLITSSTEHRAVLDTVRWLKEQGVSVTVLAPGRDGLISRSALSEALRRETKLVSIMYANNEIGVTQDMAALGEICREHGVGFHTDASQAVGKVPIDVESDKIDLLSMTAHKLYGPKGVGALYVRKKGKRLRVSSQMHGGGHESGMRSGTLNVPGIVGFGTACEIAGTALIDEGFRLREMAQKLHESILKKVSNASLNGHPVKRLPGSLSITLPGVDAQALLELLPDVCISTGSACSSFHVEPSHVLSGIGLSDADAYSTLRICIGRFNTEAEIEETAEAIGGAVAQLMEMA